MAEAPQAPSGNQSGPGSNSRPLERVLSELRALRTKSRGAPAWLQVPLWAVAGLLAALVIVLIVPFFVIFQSAMTTRGKWLTAGAYALVLWLGVGWVGGQRDNRPAPPAFAILASAPPAPPSASLQPAVVISLTFTQARAEVMVPASARAITQNVARDATGTVEYLLFNDEACSGEPVRRAGIRTLDRGNVDASDPVTFETIGHAYWRADYTTPTSVVRSGCADMPVGARRPELRVAAADVAAGGFGRATAELVTKGTLSGTVTYSAHEAWGCGDAGTPAGSQAARPGALAPSAAVRFQKIGYWRASYSGDSQNEPTDACVMQAIIPSVTPAVVAPAIRTLPPPAAAPASTATPCGRGAVVPGDTGCVTTISGEAGFIFAAISKDAYEELSRAVAINDRTGVDLLIARGRVLIVATGTRAFVLNVISSMLIIPTTSEVRLIDGSYAGRVVWMGYEFVRK